MPNLRTMKSPLGCDRQTTVKLLVASMLVAIVSSGFASTASAADSPGLFSASCRVSHVAQDDAIVFPGMPGAAHVHEFTGAISTDAFSTAESLAASGTTCDPVEDTSAYWAPRLYVRGMPVEIDHFSAYYGWGRKKSEAQRKAIKAWPQGFKLIARLTDATTEASGYPNNGWSCGNSNVAEGYEPSRTGVEYHCPGPTILEARIVFPDCWDGVNLDTVTIDGAAARNPVSDATYPNDHSSHTTYAPAGGVCPKEYPVPTPRINFQILYKAKGLIDSKANRRGSTSGPIAEPKENEGRSPSDFTLAGGGLNGAEITRTYPLSTYHADFFNGWNQSKLESLIDFCIRQAKAMVNTRPCLNPNKDATKEAPVNPNYPNATQPGLDTIITSGPSDPTSDSMPSAFEFKATTTGATFECSLDGADYTGCESPQSYTELAVGSHTFRVRATVAGMTDSSPATRTWQVGPAGSGPTVQITSPMPNEMVSGTVEVRATAVDPPATTDGTNIDRVEFSIDGILQSTDMSSAYSYMFDTTAFPDGTHKITAAAYDNDTPSQTSSTTIDVTVLNGNPADTTKPKRPSSLSTKVLSKSTISLKWKPSTDPSGIAHYIVMRKEAIAGTPTTNAFEDSGLTADTRYTYTVRAVDGAGNTSDPSGKKSATTKKK